MIFTAVILLLVVSTSTAAIAQLPRSAQVPGIHFCVSLCCSWKTVKALLRCVYTFCSCITLQLCDIGNSPLKWNGEQQACRNYKPTAQSSRYNLLFECESTAKVPNYHLGHNNCCTVLVVVDHRIIPGYHSTTYLYYCSFQKKFVPCRVVLINQSEILQVLTFCFVRSRRFLFIWRLNISGYRTHDHGKEIFHL